MLTEDQKTRYHEDGFIILPNFKSAAEIAAVRARAEAIVEAFNPADSKTIFTTNDQVRQVDRYFLDSANRISCFFEEEAFPGTTGDSTAASEGAPPSPPGLHAIFKTTVEAELVADEEDEDEAAFEGAGPAAASNFGIS